MLVYVVRYIHKIQLDLFIYLGGGPSEGGRGIDINFVLVYGDILVYEVVAIEVLFCLVKGLDFLINFEDCFKNL